MAGQTAPPARVVPGRQPDGSILLHTQWPIRPVGRQVELGDFPVNVAVDPSGRYAAVLHASRAAHEIRVVDLQTGRTLAPVLTHQTFYGLAFSADGRELVCSGGADDVVRVFDFHEGLLSPRREVKLAAPETHSAVAGVALTPDGRTAFASLLFVSRWRRWTSGRAPPCGRRPSIPRARRRCRGKNEGLEWSPGGLEDLRPLVDNADPLALVYDAGRRRVYASLWAARRWPCWTPPTGGSSPAGRWGCIPTSSCSPPTGAGSSSPTADAIRSRSWTRRAAGPRRRCRPRLAGRSSRLDARQPGPVPRRRLPLRRERGQQQRGDLRCERAGPRPPARLHPHRLVSHLGPAHARRRAAPDPQHAGPGAQAQQPRRDDDLHQRGAPLPRRPGRRRPPARRHLGPPAVDLPPGSPLAGPGLWPGAGRVDGGGRPLPSGAGPARARLRQSDPRRARGPDAHPLRHLHHQRRTGPTTRFWATCRRATAIPTSAFSPSS